MNLYQIFGTYQMFAVGRVRFRIATGLAFEVHVDEVKFIGETVIFIGTIITFIGKNYSVKGVFDSR